MEDWQEREKVLFFLTNGFVVLVFFFVDLFLFIGVCLFISEFIFLRETAEKCNTLDAQTVRFRNVFDPIK
jgi:hypothetical protein